MSFNSFQWPNASKSLQSIGGERRKVREGSVSAWWGISLDKELVYG